MCLGGRDVKGEWIESMGSGVLKREMDDEEVVVRVKIRGKIGEMS